MKVIVYGIVDKVTGYVGYVGITKNLRRRKYQHLNYRSGTAKDRWLQSINFEVDFVVLEEVEDSDKSIAEQKWVAHIKSLGGADHNSTIGGVGNPCRYPNSETRLKMRLKKLGIPLKDEHKAKLKGLANGNQHAKGYKHTEEARKKISDANRGTKKALGHRHDDETKKKIALASKGKVNSPETIAKMRETHLAMSEKKREDMKRVWAERKAKKGVNYEAEPR
jgi:predicted GIY-YIG superfamily endonuclease